MAVDSIVAWTEQRGTNEQQEMNIQPNNNDTDDNDNIVHVHSTLRTGGREASAGGGHALRRRRLGRVRRRGVLGPGCQRLRSQLQQRHVLEWRSGGTTKVLEEYMNKETLCVFLRSAEQNLAGTFWAAGTCCSRNRLIPRPNASWVAAAMDCGIWHTRQRRTYRDNFSATAASTLW